MTAYINISLQGTVYFITRGSTEDDGMVRLYSSKLVMLMNLYSTFDVLYSQLSGEWHHQDDVVNPFLDRRRVHAIFCDSTRSIPLSLRRQRSITISDFEHYEPPATPGHTLQSIFPPPYWKMRRKDLDLQCLERHKAFVGRVLADLAFQWRHILCGRYNNSTFRRLACAIIRIVTLDFEVEEVTLSRRGIGGFLVWMNNLPEWGPFSGSIVRIGGASIVICQHIPHAITLIQKDFGKRVLTTLDHNLCETFPKTFTYLILSVQETILYRINKESRRYTKCERLLDDTHPPSYEAIELLLEAIQASAFMTPIHRLPVELQDMILDRVSAGPIESARVGCVLNAGSEFTWKCGDRNIEREEGRRNRTEWSPVESHILFGNCSSVIAYK
ncbi:uncharacterized protein BDZ99DRAFT_509235 [Mytilinidion resinicola]|uniref:Uncharacterized protein n=1 Tax=Mytilinidion resinicola TaxID=574789 RepID=A0A6A6YIJ9_9PEZI|nr:uncharacterized protein BDZ99DRAFT_509235 [Mytilinidion resinicola]KAF2808676.1 hypothetical protein BDZ99DRAFT_509235 [Mytilinidion resinicola]